MLTVEIRNRAVLVKVMKKHAAARKPLAQWIEITEQAEWHNIVDVRRTFQTADYVGRNLTCFNIGGNNFRLLAVISYELQIVSIHEFLTHEEYNRKYT